MAEGGPKMPKTSAQNGSVGKLMTLYCLIIRTNDYFTVIDTLLILPFFQPIVVFYSMHRIGNHLEKFLTNVDMVLLAAVITATHCSAEA